jgi:hypothetical protein
MATEVELPRLKVWLILYKKGFDSIVSYINHGREFSTESIRSRFVDAITYLILAAGMVYEDKLKEGGPLPPGTLVAALVDVTTHMPAEDVKVMPPGHCSYGLSEDAKEELLARWPRYTDHTETRPLEFEELQRKGLAEQEKGPQTTTWKLTPLGQLVRTAMGGANDPH